VHLVAKKSIYVPLWLAEKNPLHALSASSKTSCKFTQASRKPEKNTAYGYSWHAQLKTEFCRSKVSCLQASADSIQCTWIRKMKKFS